MKVYYDYVMNIWYVDFGSHKEYFCNEPAARRAACGM